MSGPFTCCHNAPTLRIGLFTLVYIYKIYIFMIWNNYVYIITYSWVIFKIFFLSFYYLNRVWGKNQSQWNFSKNHSKMYELYWRIIFDIFSFYLFCYWILNYWPISLICKNYRIVYMGNCNCWMSFENHDILLKAFCSAYFILSYYH